MANNYVIDVSELYNLIDDYHNLQKYLKDQKHTVNGTPAGTVPHGNVKDIKHWSSIIKLNNRLWKTSADKKSKTLDLYYTVNHGQSAHFTQKVNVQLTLHGVPQGVSMTVNAAHLDSYRTHLPIVVTSNKVIQTAWLNSIEVHVAVTGV